MREQARRMAAAFSGPFDKNDETGQSIKKNRQFLAEPARQ
jgi:hypothetical protein